jgi:phage-related protein (TIGR01555 family)
MVKKNFFDGFVNLLKSFGSSNDTREQTSYNYTKRISRLYETIDDLYTTSWLAAKVVDIPVNDVMREGRTFNIEDEIKLKEFQEYYIEIDKKINLGLKYARAFGGAALIVVSKDDDLFKPLNMMKQGDLLNIAVVDAGQLIPQTLDRNPLSPNYLKPESYTIVGSSQSIDKSRVYYIDGITTTNREREKNNGFGSSIYERLHKEIEDATQTSTALRNLVEQSNIDIVKMKDLNDAIASGAEDVAKERLQVLSQMKSILNTIAIDGEDDYVNISKNFASLPQVQMNMYQIVAAAADIPFTRFMGKSADGQNATGEGDLINYYDAIKGEIQIGQLKPIYSFLDPIVYNHLYGTKEQVEYEFNPLWQLSETEEAELQTKKANVHAIYFDRGIVDEDAVLTEIQNDGLYSNYDPKKGMEF